MNQDKIREIKTQVKKKLDKERYQHTQGVMYMAGALAMCYGADVERAMLAGVLHDCAKCIPNDEKIELCEKHNLEIKPVERKNPGLLHAKLGAYLAWKKYQVKDREILDAITYHSTGRPDMTLLDKIIFLADYLEPCREEAPNLTELRTLAFHDLDECLRRVLSDTLEYLKKRDMAIDPMTEQTFRYYEG